MTRPAFSAEDRARVEATLAARVTDCDRPEQAAIARLLAAYDAVTAEYAQHQEALSGVPLAARSPETSDTETPP